MEFALAIDTRNYYKSIQDTQGRLALGMFFFVCFVLLVLVLALMFYNTFFTVFLLRDNKRIKRNTDFFCVFSDVKKNGNIFEDVGHI